MPEGKNEAWIEAGFAELARSGVEGVRVEVLAKNLGVTKGGFYRRFRDRAALLEAMLQNWSAGRIAAIEKHTSLDGATARERLRGLIPQYSEHVNTEGMAVELAIRQWARSDELAAGAAAHVDAARLKNVGNLFRATGLPAKEADAPEDVSFEPRVVQLAADPQRRAQPAVGRVEALEQRQEIAFTEIRFRQPRRRSRRR